MTSTERLLLDCLHQDPARLDPDALSRLTGQDWDALLDLARRQHVRPLIFRRLMQADVDDAVPEPVLESLRAACRRIGRRNLALHAELARLLEILGGAGIPVILLKGMHAASAVYGNLALREIGDMDLLVRREDLERATSLVLGAGYAPAKPFNIDVDVAVSQHVSVLYKPPHFAVELHWNLTEPRQPYTIDPSSLWERAQPVHLGHTKAWGLASEDLLLHLCLHLAYQHRFEFGLRSLCDAAALLSHRATRLAWPVVQARAAEWNWQRGVALTLTLARDWIGATVPSAALEAPPFETIPEKILEAAGLQLVGGYNPTATPGRRLSMLDDHAGARNKGRHLARVVFLPVDDLRRAYPRVPTAVWGWWVVYVIRCKDLIQRHTRPILRRWIRRDPRLRSIFDRQRLLRSFLTFERISSRET